MGRTSVVAAVGLALFLTLTATAAASPPTISYSIDGLAGTNGWFRGSSSGDNVVVHWSVSLDATSTNCLAAVPVPGPSAGTTQTCWAANADGTTTAVTHVIKIDAVPPTGITFRMSRKTDHHGWYNHPVTIRWSGSDATSGIASCALVNYRGPDSGAATVNRGCTDKAGNSAFLPVRFAYDATPPRLQHVAELSTGAADVLSWASSDAADRIVVRRAVRGRKAHKVFVGTGGRFVDTKIHAGTEYVYSLRSFDQAGNSSRAVFVAGFPKILTLQKAAYVPRAAPSPILRWGPVRGARYYNVQLFRGSKRIFAAWPTRHRTVLPTSWKWSGRRFRLAPGRYRWYVWAGLGPRSLARYRAVGNATFVVPGGPHRGHAKSRISTSAG